MAPRMCPPSLVRSVSLVVVFLLLSGCIEDTDKTDPGQDPKDHEVLIDPSRPTESFGEIVTGPAVGPDLNATTAQAPRLVTGEWWRIRFDSELEGVPIEVVRVVADVNEDGYIFGMPHEGWLKEAIAYHAPAFGDVGFDLSYATHNQRFEPVRFPLVQGNTWETVFATSPLIATVEQADERTATIAFKSATPPQPTDPATDAIGMTQTNAISMRLYYDASRHEIVKMDSFIGTWEVVEHGYHFEGWITVPRGEHTAIDYGAFGPASETHDPMGAREIEVSGQFNRMTLMHAIFALSPGTYSIRSESPNGTVFETTHIGADPFTVRFYEASDPDGTWQAKDVNVGVGGTYAMGIAYHQYDIRLPDGVRRSDHSHAVIR